MNKTKKLLSALVCAAMLCAVLPCVTVGAETNISIGDYVQMGTYYGAPILWRCVDIDENGPLMLSDKIICLKPYDAAGDDTSGSHIQAGRPVWGSNYWADSNMRSWLNSDASAGNVIWLCGNPPCEDKVWEKYNDYADEAGFMTNFSQRELNAVKEVTQKSILSYFDQELDTTEACEYHQYKEPIEDVVQNYDSCYAEYVTDKFFLLDVKQINAVYNNGSVLGDDYYIGEPTAECVANSEYEDSDLAAGNKWKYWLRTPTAWDESWFGDTRYAESDGNIYTNYVWVGSFGVRPAFYINLSSVSFESGDGTEISPYTVEEPAAEIVASGECGDNLTWTLDSEGVLTISGTGAMTEWSSYSSVPWYSNSSSIKTVVIENGVTSIGRRAFSGCERLTSVTIPDSVTSIGNRAFYECTGLTSITIPIGVTSIEFGAFGYCESLTSVTIPDSVTSIGSEAFGGCSSLTSVTIPIGVTSIGYDAFYDTAYYNDETNWENGVLYIDNALIDADSDVSGDYQIKEGTICIADYAFCDCSSLTSVTIPNSVTSIGYDAFEYCTGLTSVTIGNSVTNIGSYTFCECTGLTSVTIPDSVTSIGKSAFDSCTGLTSITIPDSVTSIGYQAFCCSGLTSITIPDSVTEIGLGAFEWCDSLTDVYYSGSEEDWSAIGIDDENECLTSATIHYNSTGPEPTTGIVASGECGDNLTWTLDSNGVLTISGTGAMTDWDDYSSVPWYSNSSSINTVVMESGVTSIGAWAFYYCTGLTSVSIGIGVTTIGKNAFYGCESLTSVTIPNSVTSIGYCAFSECTGLTSVTIPDSVTSIGEYAFYRCTGLTSVTIPIGVTEIGSYAFYGCYGLTSVSIGSGVTSICKSAFYKCDSLTDVYYSGSEEDWNAISIDDKNECLTSATIHYNSTGPVPEIADVKLTTETDEETGAEVITVTVETEDIFESNALIAVGLGDSGVISVSAIENGEATLPAEGVKTVKVFAWESLESMKPLCEAKEVIVQ